MKQLKVFVLNPFTLDVSYEELDDEEFMAAASDEYTVEEFIEAFNDNEVDTSFEVIRAITVVSVNVDIETMGLNNEPRIHVETDEDSVPMKEIYRIMHKRMKNAKSDKIRSEVFDILQEIKFPEDYK